jgi:hypothetical protein
MSQAKRVSSIISSAVAVLAMLSMTALGATSAHAQEDVTGPPPALQWPTSAGAHPGGALPFQVDAASTMGLRHSIEDAADLELCKMLMKDANMPVPSDPNFAYANCPSSIKAKIDSGDGKYAWADGARPTQCGRNCVGPPFMMQTQNADRPNAQYAMVLGSLTFRVDTPGPFNRDVYYGLEIDVTCDVPAGTRAGTANVTTHVNGPTADDPGFLETVFNFLALPIEFSQRITDGINEGYGASTTPGPNQGPCSSMGVIASPPAEFKFDAFVWDIPKPPRRPPIPDVTTLKPTATLYFDKIIRNRTIETNPSMAPLTFTLYINGMPAHIPRNGTISLAPNASTNQKFCRAIPMDGMDSLQILFVDSLGGAVWSQFTSGQNFGSSGEHKMTTGRTYLMPGLHPGDKPQNGVLREFELDYRVNYQAGPTSANPTPAPANPSRGGRPTPPAAVFAPPDQPPPDSSCIRI